ncbi:hypothetical protein C8Q70DRAFT_971442 [Cubamyces menziesii]|nr:hypothetical protein C8Q70DRAFT_971442 [Cubamyces menziesii]
MILRRTLRSISGRASFSSRTSAWVRWTIGTPSLPHIFASSALRCELVLNLSFHTYTTEPS